MTRRNRNLLVAAVVLLFGLGAALVAVQLWAYHHYRAAEQALETWDFAGAANHLTACLKVWRDDASVFFLAARTARRSGDVERAAYYRGVCEKLQGVTSATALERALQQAQEGDLVAVESSLQALVSGNSPDALYVLESLAQGHLLTLHIPEALRETEQILRRQPNHWHALVWRGRAKELLNQYDEALADYQRAVELYPASDQARLRLADTLQRLGHVREAVGHYEYLRRQAPARPEVLLPLARCRHDLHDLDEAQRLLDELLDARPDLPRALVERGRLELHRQNPIGAEGWLRRAAEQTPHDRDAHFLLQFCLEWQGKDAEARQWAARLQEIERQTTRVAARMAQALSSPHDPALRHEIGIMLLRSGDEDQAVRWLLSALQEDPNYQPAKAALADVYRRRGQAPGN